MESSEVAAEDASNPVAVKHWFSRHLWAVAGSVVVLFGFWWLLRAGALPIVPSMSSFGRVRWWTVPVYVLIWLSIHTTRCGRWYWLLLPIHKVSLKRVIAVGFIGYGALIVLPFRTGEVVRPALIRKRGELSAWAATGTVGAERVIDGLCLSLTLFLALQFAKPVSPLPDHIGELPIPAALVPKAAYTALVVFFTAFSAMGLFYWRREWARWLIGRLVAPFSKRFATWAESTVARVAEGLTFLTELRYSGPFILTTLVVWAMNIGGVHFLCWGAGIEGLTFAQAAAVTGVLALGVIAPNAPGFFGAFQMSLYAGLAMYLAPEDVTGAGSAFVFLLYVCQIGVTFLAAVAGLAMERRAGRGLASS